jgi:predicted NAD-dependent protein-ADP-ribosyltransferase YbiA (DUF1768 family)
MKPTKTNENQLNIRSDSSNPIGKILSNLADTPFEVEGIIFPSVESALQGIKFKDPKKQQEVFKMDGKSALLEGRKVTLSIKDDITEYVYWKGKEIKYNSNEHRMLVAMFIREKIRQNKKVQEALLATEENFIFHDVGQENPNTSLPEKLYIEILLAERKILKKLETISIKIDGGRILK